ncbi:unnamed protein product, partial [Ilex paraguariensis]
PIAGPIHSSPPHSPHQSGPLFSPPIDHSPPISTPILTPALDEDSTATGSSAPTDKDISTSPIVTCRRSTRTHHLPSARLCLSHASAHSIANFFASSLLGYSFSSFQFCFL